MTVDPPRADPPRVDPPRVDPPSGLADLTPTIQAYLMAAHHLGSGGDPVTPGALADRLGASPSSVTEGVRKLAAMGLAQHRPYAPVELTETGRSFAVAMVRRHRILETFLARCLEYPWDEVHAEADALEHVVSDRFVDALDGFLDHPRRDPHGDPIPTRDGRLDQLADVPLDRVPEGCTGVVTRVSDRDNSVLRHLAEIGLRPDSPVEVVSRQVELGIITVALDGRVVPVGTPVAAAVRVRVPNGDVDDDDDQVTH
ncbi:MAG: metal-dependent transcriptional regulator [Dietzia sp.]